MSGLPVALFFVAHLTQVAAWLPKALVNPKRIEVLPRSQLRALKEDASVVFLVPATDVQSRYGESSPRPNPSWTEVATHLAKRITYFDDRCVGGGLT